VRALPPGRPGLNSLCSRRARSWQSTVATWITSGPVVTANQGGYTDGIVIPPEPKTHHTPPPPIYDTFESSYVPAPSATPIVVCTGNRVSAGVTVQVGLFGSPIKG